MASSFFEPTESLLAPPRRAGFDVRKLSVHYRLYHPDDFAQLYAIEEICFQPPFRFGRRYMRDLINSSSCTTWIAEENGRLAGFAIVEVAAETGRSIAYVPTIEVAPGHRQQGIGAVLLRHLETSAQTAGAATIWLHVDAQNEVAIRLYRAQGYQQQGREQHYYARGRAADIFAKSLLPG